MNREEALTKIEELKKYLEEIDKDNNKFITVKYSEIKHVFKSAIKKLKEDLCSESLENKGKHWASCDRIPQRDILQAIDKYFGEDYE